MLVPISVVVCARPRAPLLHHLWHRGSSVIASRTTIDAIGATGPRHLTVEGRFVVSDPDVYHRSPGCDCCAAREDLVASVIRTLRRAESPERLVVVVDPTSEDALTVVSTLLSSIEITRRCSLDAVIVQVDAVEMATRHATGSHLVDDDLVPALAIADRVIVHGHDQITDSALRTIRALLAVRSGFAPMPGVAGDGIDPDDRLDAWHGAPRALPVEPTGWGRPGTIVLRVDEQLDPDAIDEWLDQLIAQHASRLFRIQGALSVVGNTERTCCYGIRSLAISHSEGEHPAHRSTESVLAICGIGLDVQDLAAGFRATVAS